MCTAALAALESIYDPEIGLNVVDLGLIYQIDFDESKNEILCTMTLTTQFCPMGEAISNGVSDTLTGTFPGYQVNVQLTFDPPWNYELISQEGRAFLKR
jgi:metal-sulfur cluster biosynthetic enzyme